MKQSLHAIEDDSLATLRSLAIRRHVEHLEPLQRDVLSLLHGIGCAPLSADRAAKRLGLTPRDVWKKHDEALQELGLLAILEAAA